MTVFRYDKSFEGLLTALFDAYVRRTFPDALLGAGEPEPMFAGETYEVMTQRDKADRVWRGLNARIDWRARNMMLHVWLSEEPDSDALLLRYMRKVLDSGGAVVADFADPDALRVKQLAQKVANEGCYVREFIRLQKGADGTYFGATAPKFNALPLAIDHFKDRFADQKWLVYDTKRRYGYYYDLHKVTEVTMEDDAHLLDGKLSDEMMATDEKLFQELWKNYFKSVTIKERINPKLQRQHMPRRFWKYLTEKQ